MEKQAKRRGGAFPSVVLLAVAVMMLISACSQPFDPQCRSDAVDPEGEFKYSEEEAAVACFVAPSFATPDIFKSGADGTITLNPQGLKASMVVSVLQMQARDLDLFLSYEDRDFATAVDWYRGLRKNLEHKEDVTHAALERFALVSVFNEFVKSVGPLPESVKKDSKALAYYFPAGPESYSIRLLYSPEHTWLSEIPFVAGYVEAAKAEGTLKLVERFEYLYSRQFAEKVPDLYDPNKFAWDKETRGWLVEGYKILPKNGEPSDGAIHYIEVRRNDPSRGAPEMLPAIRGFLPSGGSNVKVFLIDYDKEGEAGHGVPDKVESALVTITSARELFDLVGLRDRILAQAYQRKDGIDRTRPERRRPPEVPIYVAIARTGEVSVDVWEDGAWSVPFSYQELRATNEITYAKDPQNLPPAHPGTVLKRIDRFVRAYLRDNKAVAVEYRKPKDEYSARDIENAYAFPETVRIRRKGQLELEGAMEYFAGRIVQIDYAFGGKWTRIVDEDGDGKFEKRREITEPESAMKASKNAAGQISAQ